MAGADGGIQVETDLREFFLGEEVHTSIRLVEKGLAEIQGIDAVNDFYYPALLLLSSGLERLMKCILCFRAKATTGELPTHKAIKAFGHDLEHLRDEIVTQCFEGEYRSGRLAADADAVFLESDLRLRALLTALSRFAQSARYYNLDMVGDRQPDTDGPEQEWQRLEMEVVFERADLLNALQAPASLAPVYEAISREFVGRIEVLARALCRLFTLGPLGEDAQRYTAYLRPFLFLRDGDLAKRDYREARHVEQADR
jgi:hypothetical protein